MSDNPFVPFYTSDFLAGTSGMTAATKGVYITLLSLMYEAEAPLPQSWETLARRCGCTKSSFRKAIETLEDDAKIHVTDAGIWSGVLHDWAERARKNEKRPWVPLAVQRHVFERDGNKCTYCGDTEGPFHLDHILPWALGGNHEIGNLTVACAQCNWSKGSKTLSEWRGF